MQLNSLMLTLRSLSLWKSLIAFLTRKPQDLIEYQYASPNDNKLTLAPLITYLDNLIINTSIFPKCWKIALVKLLFKKGDKTRCNNYTPISILNSTSKVSEKLLSMQMRVYSECKELLTNYQFGIRWKRSTTDTINIITEHLYDHFNDGRITQGQFVDLSKAFFK